MSELNKRMDNTQDSQPPTIPPFVASNGSETGAVAAKWECTTEEAEQKIISTMRIMALDRPNAVTFLLSVHLDFYGKSPNDQAHARPNNP